MNEVMTQTTMKPKGGPKTLIEIDLSQSPYTNDMITIAGTRTFRWWPG